MIGENGELRTEDQMHYLWLGIMVGHIVCFGSLT